MFIRWLRAVQAGGACLLVAGYAMAGPAVLDPAVIQSGSRLNGKLNAAGDVFKVTWSRTDVAVAVDGWPMPAFMGLTAWAGFSAGKQGGCMVMGDLVLFQDEVNPVMSAVLDAGLEVTALHNHFFFDEPKVYFMHVAGEGPLEKLAAGVGAAVTTIRGVRAAAPRPAAGFGGPPLPAASALTATVLESALGMPGERKDGMVKFVVGRTATMACACPAGKDQGINTWAAFAGADDNAVVDGDFSVTEAELQPVLKALRHGGINVVAIHHHMTGEKPRLLFLHYWGRGPAAELARTVAAGLAVSGPAHR